MTMNWGLEMRESHCLDTDLKHRRDFGGNRTRICDRRSSLLATSVADDETDITYTRRVLDFCKTNEDEQCNNQKLSKGREQMTHIPKQLQSKVRESPSVILHLLAGLPLSPPSPQFHNSEVFQASIPVL